jgi:peptidoglycan/xylan/chitin deacetylase (PgdA/CDA1 family)
MNLTSLEKKNLDNNYIPQVIDNLLALLECYNQKATFFIVTELYDWYPEFIEKIKLKGHEIAHHTHQHALLKSYDILKKEMILSENFIQKFHPMGFRAPQIYMRQEYFLLLKKYGFKYSSSSYNSFRIDKIEGVDEIPVSTFPFQNKKTEPTVFPHSLSIKLFIKNFPFGSGLGIALIGAKISYFINKLNEKKIPAVIFIHPWQLYHSKEIKKFSFKVKVLFRNFLCFPYTFLLMRSFKKILKTHEFTSFKEYFCYN